jgi:hypothetical protein
MEIATDDATITRLSFNSVNLKLTQRIAVAENRAITVADNSATRIFRITTDAIAGST